MLKKLFYRLRLLSFLTVLFFWPFSELKEIFLESGELILKNYLLVALLFICVHKLIQLIAGSVIKRKTVGNKTRTSGQNMVFFLLLFICVVFIICPLTLLRFYNSDFIFYILLSMLAAKVFEVIFEQKKLIRAHIIFVIIFDTLAGTLSFQLFKSSNLLFSLIFSMPLALQNSLLYVASYLEDCSTPEKRKKSKKKNKKNAAPKQIVYPKSLSVLYPVLAVAAPAVMGVFIVLQLLSHYYYLVFLSILCSVSLISSVSLLRRGGSLPMKILNKTALNCLLFAVMLATACLLSQLFPFA